MLRVRRIGSNRRVRARGRESLARVGGVVVGVNDVVQCARMPWMIAHHFLGDAGRAHIGRVRARKEGEERERVE